MQWKPISVVPSCWGLVNATQKHNSLSCWSSRVSLAQWTVSGALPRHQNYFLDPAKIYVWRARGPVTTTTQTGWSFFWILLNLLQWRRQNTLSKIFQLKIYHTVNRRRSFLTSSYSVIPSFSHLVIQSFSHPIIQSFIISFSTLRLTDKQHQELQVCFSNKYQYRENNISSVHGKHWLVCGSSPLTWAASLLPSWAPIIGRGMIQTLQPHTTLAAQVNR